MAGRTTNIMTISIPPAMALEMEIIQKKEHRTRSELLREAWRLYFESRFPIYKPTKAERAGIKKGRADIKAGRFVTLEQLKHDLGLDNHANSRKGTRKARH
jgi:predicted transcriptional regulator